MVRNLVLFLVLFLCWILLSGHFSLFFLVLGVISCVVSVVLFDAMYPQKKQDKFDYAFFARLPSYVGWLVKEIALSTASITLKTWSMKPDISPVMSWISTSCCDDLSLTIYANSITLTPGTVSINTKDGMIQVHSIDGGGIDDLRDGVMNNKVLKLVHNVEGR